MLSSTSIFGASLLAYAGTAAALATNITGTLHQNSARSYSLVDTYDSGNFFSDFSFFTGADPTEGFVDYQSESAASSQGLINTNHGQVCAIYLLLKNILGHSGS
jgi:hypothetical protein